MRCPNCGYTSFDYLDKCKVCGEDLVPAKIKLNIYTRPPEMEMDEQGFNTSRIGKPDAKDMIEDSKKENLSVEELLTQETQDLADFSFEDHKTP